MIIWSPFILDELAGLRDSAPPTINDDPTSRDLAGKTGIVTKLSGPSNPDGAAWGDVRYFGITNDADTDAAMEFVKFAMDEGYTQTLSIAPEGKFPVRRGNADNPPPFSKPGQSCLWASTARPRWVSFTTGDDRRDRRRPGRGAALGRGRRTAVAGLEDDQQPGHQPDRPSVYRRRDVDAAAAVAAMNEELAKVQ